jgi:hypothetical protein
LHGIARIRFLQSCSPPFWRGIRQFLIQNNCFFCYRSSTLCSYPTRSLPANFWHLYTEWSIVRVSTKAILHGLLHFENMPSFYNSSKNIQTC